MAAHDHGDRQAAERLEGGSGTQEDLPKWRFGKAVLEVPQQGVPDRFEERQHHFLAPFLRADADPGVLPVEVIQKQFGRRDAPNAVRHHQDGNGVVAGAYRAILVDRREHAVQGRVFQAFGQRGMPIASGGRH